MVSRTLPGRPRHSSASPDAQNAIDIFAGEWASRFPPPFEALEAGRAALFEDARLQWAIDEMGGVHGRSILELGPLEGGHTYLLDRAGAGRILAIEGNPRAYLKCLIAKELLGIPSGRFVHGDFTEYLRREIERVDLVVASGVLYHMVRPVELLANIAAASDAVFVWTHYYDAALIRERPELRRRLVAPEVANHGGYAHQLYKHVYGAVADSDGFCGGSAPYSYWLSREDILGALEFFGFDRMRVANEEPRHPNGPAFSVLATRTGAR